jgi:flavodoxin
MPNIVGFDYMCALPHTIHTTEENGMKKFLVTAMVFFCLFGTLKAQSQSTARRILVVYFSMPLPNVADTVSGASRMTMRGNSTLTGDVQFVAQTIQRATGGDIFRLETAQPYPQGYDPFFEYARSEQRKKSRPQLSGVPNVTAYDVVFLGYPIWMSDLPMPLYTFLEGVDLGGKTVIPFNVHGGSGLSNTVRTIAALQPRAQVVTDAFTVSRDRVARAENDITAWVRERGMAR